MSGGRECTKIPLSGKETSWCFNLSVKVSLNIVNVSLTGGYKVWDKKNGLWGLGVKCLPEPPPPPHTRLGLGSKRRKPFCSYEPRGAASSYVCQMMRETPEYDM